MKVHMIYDMESAFTSKSRCNMNGVNTNASIKNMKDNWKYRKISK